MSREACAFCQADVTHVVRLAGPDNKITGAARTCAKHGRARAKQARAAGNKAKVSKITVPGNWRTQGVRK